MNDMISSLNGYLKESRAYAEQKNYADARVSLLHACECALLLAKSSSGQVQESYLKTYRALRELLVELDAKIEATTPCTADPTPPPVTESAPAPAPTEENVTPHGKGSPGSTPPHIAADSLSPKWLSEYIGQPQAVTAVKDLIAAALLRDAALPHILLYGSHGLGKTTFSKIIANEMHANFVEVNVTNINVAAMIAILKKLKPRDVLFIDEIHTLPTAVAESVLYSAMQDGRITYTEGKGKFTKTETFELPPFTLIGATTEIGKIAKPFIQRAIQVRLEEYTDEVLARIISASFYKRGMRASEEISLSIAKRCRNNPRIANNTVKRISDKALVRYAALNNIKSNGFFSDVEQIRKSKLEIEASVVHDFFEENGIDEYGLESGDRELLRLIITRYGGGPVGIDTLARALNEANNVISQKYESYLIKKGMIKIEREGRVAMAEGYRALHMPIPQNVKEADQGALAPNADAPSKKYETRRITASLVPEPLKCDRIEALIVYPENPTISSAPLDLLFPNVEKPYTDVTKHACELEIDFGDHKRLLECDSFLESRFATVLAKVGYLTDMKAQTLEIPYISQQLSDRRYFPDFVIKDYKGRIAVLEMKNFDVACYHLNIDKYEHLSAYCREHGYGYAEIMKPYDADEYVSIEELKNKPVNRQLEEFIIKKIEENARTSEAEFTLNDWKEYNRLYGEIDKTEIYTVLLNNRQLRNTDRIGTDMRITLL